MNRMIPAGLDGKGKSEGQEQKIKDEHRTSNIEPPTSNEKIEKLATPEEWTAYSTGQADPHRLTQTFIRRTPDKQQATRLTGQASPDKNGHRFAKKEPKRVIASRKDRDQPPAHRGIRPGGRTED